MSEILVSDLAIYPVKSLAQISLKTSAVEAFGLQSDRRWMVIDTNQYMITQRQQSRMCLIQVTLTSDGIQLSAPGMNQINLQQPDATVKRQVTVWRDNCTAYDAGDPAARWLGKFLNIDCRLVYFPDNTLRAVDPEYAQPDDKTAFSDGFPILLTSTPSLEDLNSKMEQPLSMQRFRPNIVISGCEPYAEDNWRRIKIGDITMRVVKPCSRCIIPSIDPQTGERGDEPTRVLVKYRKRDNKVYFGQNVIADTTGNITVGMPVEVLE